VTTVESVHTALKQLICYCHSAIISNKWGE